MKSIFYKNKQLLVLIVKILIVLGAFYFIYKQLADNDKLNWTNFLIIFEKQKSISGVIFILFLSFLNRFLEILKWQNLVSSFQKISLRDTTKQVLAALTAGIFTPNGIGEYAGKALYFEKKETKKIVFLNLICNGIQMILSIFFGLIGLWVLGFKKWVFYLIMLSVLLFVFSVFFKNITIKGNSLKSILKKIKEIPTKIHQKNIVFAILRYLTFSHQYYFLFLAFGVHQPYFILMATIASVYFLASSLPTFQFFDFAVKGGVAVYFFNLLFVNEWIVVFISTVMWFLNIVIPVIIGSYFVIKFKPKWN